MSRVDTHQSIIHRTLDESVVRHTDPRAELVAQIHRSQYEFDVAFLESFAQIYKDHSVTYLDVLVQKLRTFLSGITRHSRS